MRLTTFGTVDLEGVADPQLVLTQPKLLSLLVYLVLARRGKFQRRERLAALLWGEQPEERARASLRTALSSLRGALGEEVILRRGDGEIGIDATRLQCDALEFEDALKRDELAYALELYRGPCLDGLIVDSSAMQHWLDEVREGYRSTAATAAWTLAERYETQSADLTSAARWARRAARLAGNDERRVRRVMQLLVRAGDVAGAMSVFTEFARFIKADLEIEPSRETLELVQAIRERRLGN